VHKVQATFYIYHFGVVEPTEKIPNPLARGMAQENRYIVKKHALLQPRKKDEITKSVSINAQYVTLH
jgi:hypothetical protein